MLQNQLLLRVEACPDTSRRLFEVLFPQHPVEIPWKTFICRSVILGTRNAYHVDRKFTTIFGVGKSRHSHARDDLILSDDAVTTPDAILVQIV